MKLTRLLILVLVSGAAAEAQTFNVLRANVINCTRYIRDSNAGDLATQIAAAVAAGPPAGCQTDTRIHIASGVWDVSSPPIKLNKSNLLLESDGYGTIIHMTTTGSSDHLIEIGDPSVPAENIKIGPMTLTGSGHGVGIYYWGGTVDGSGCDECHISVASGPGSGDGGSGFDYAVDVSDTSGGSHYNNYFRDGKIQGNPANLSAAQNGIRISYKGHAFVLRDNIVVDNNSNSTGGVGIEVQDSTKVVISGGNIQGWKGHNGISGTDTSSGNVYDLTVSDVYFEPCYSGGSCLDWEVGTGSVLTTFSRNHHDGQGIQTYLVQLDDGAAHTVFEWENFVGMTGGASGYAVHNLGTTNNTYSFFVGNYTGVGNLVDSTTGVQFDLESGKLTLPWDNMIVGAQRGIYAERYVDVSDGGKSTYATLIEMAKGNFLDWQSHLTGAAAWSAGTTYSANQHVTWTRPADSDGLGLCTDCDWVSLASGNTGNEPDLDYAHSWWAQSRVYLVTTASDALRRDCSPDQSACTDVDFWAHIGYGAYGPASTGSNVSYTVVQSPDNAGCSPEPCGTPVWQTDNLSLGYNLYTHALKFLDNHTSGGVPGSWVIDTSIHASDGAFILYDTAGSPISQWEFGGTLPEDHREFWPLWVTSLSACPTCNSLTTDGSAVIGGSLAYYGNLQYGSSTIVDTSLNAYLTSGTFTGSVNVNTSATDIAGYYLNNVGVIQYAAGSPGVINIGNVYNVSASGDFTTTGSHHIDAGSYYLSGAQYLKLDSGTLQIMSGLELKNAGGTYEGIDVGSLALAGSTLLDGSGNFSSLGYVNASSLLVGGVNVVDSSRNGSFLNLSFSGTGPYSGGTGVSVSGNSISNTGVTGISGSSPVSVSASTGSVIVSCSGCLQGSGATRHTSGVAQFSSGTVTVNTGFSSITAAVGGRISAAAGATETVSACANDTGSTCSDSGGYVTFTSSDSGSNNYIYYMADGN